MQHIGQRRAVYHIIAQCADCLLAARDMERIIKRLLDPLANHAGAHRSVRLVEHPKQRSFLLLGAHGLAQLQIASCVKVQFHILTLTVKSEVVQTRKARRLRLFQIVEQTAERVHRKVHHVKTVFLEVLDMEIPADTLSRCLRLKALVLHRLHQCVLQTLTDKAAEFVKRNRKAALPEFPSGRTGPVR